MNNITVLTGDIVNSRKTNNKKWLNALNECLSHLVKNEKKWEIYRGDSFQIEVKPEDALFIAILIRLYMRQIPAIDTRISIGFGKKKYANKSIKEATGTAFEYSGLAFETLKSNKKLLIFNSSKSLIDIDINIYLDLFSHIISSWTPTMCSIIYFSILHKDATQMELAELLSRKQSQISQVYKKTGYYELIKCIDNITDKIALL